MGYVLFLRGKKCKDMGIINSLCFINKTKWEINEL